MLINSKEKNPPVTSTTTTATLNQPIEPIDLNQAHDYIADELWKVLCDCRSSSWLDEIGKCGRDQPDIAATLDVWSQMLTTSSRDPVKAIDAESVLSHLIARKQQIENNRYIYSHTTPQEIRHKYWPTGKSEHLETDNLYKMNLCVKANKFITPQTKIMSAGSCFAFEIGKMLRAWDYNYFITEQGPAHYNDEEKWKQHYGRFAARYGPMFNAPSIRQLIERGLGQIELHPYIFEQDGLWRDPYRDGLTFNSPTDYTQSIPPFLEALRRALLEAEVFILTLGVNEVWYFQHDHTILSRVPWKLSPTLLDKKVLTVNENVVELNRLREMWLQHNPGLRIIVTVSPVPLLATFQADVSNVVVANCHSKATLRVAAEDFARAHKNVTYFPAYEAVVHGTQQPFRKDGRHVSQAGLARVMQLFKEVYCVDA